MENKIAFKSKADRLRRLCLNFVTHHFRSRNKDGSHTIRFAISENPMLHTNFVARFLSYCRSKFYTAGIGILYLFYSCDLDLDPMTFICELDPYSIETYRMCENELPKSML